MLQLASATAMCEADSQRRAGVLELVSRLLASAFPPAVRLHCFGSSANGLGTSDSDLDIHLGERNCDLND
jgi:DNA polymerase sigma